MVKKQKIKKSHAEEIKELLSIEQIRKFVIALGYL